MNPATGTAPGIASNVVLGAFLMVASAACFAGTHTIVRFATAEVHALEVVFFRFAFGCVLLLPLAMRRRFAQLRTRQLGSQMLCGVFNASTTFTIFWALMLLPIAEATALNFTVPMFTLLFSALLLKEKVDFGRATAVVAGFAGVLIIVRPGFSSVSWPVLLPIAAALQLACAMLLTKRLTRTDGPMTILMHQSLWSSIFAGFALPFVWSEPGWTTILIALAMAGLGTVGIFLTARAMALADASVMVPFDYARLLFVAVLAYFVYAEVPGLWTWIGGAVIAAASIYLARRERRAEQARRLVEVSA
ncbi:MAG: DMT family transporter [Alphaproteobacteria bacterium]|nr:DMT family transporter [Alphaproteobacteria bacterium]